MINCQPNQPYFRNPKPRNPDPSQSEPTLTLNPTTESLEALLGLKGHHGCEVEQEFRV